MMFAHAAVWIDGREAKIFHIEPEGFEVSNIKTPHRHLTRKAEEQGRHEGGDRFYHEVAEALRDAAEILVVGPSSAKLDLVRYVSKHAHAIEPRILGVETLDHPTDAQLAAYVRHYFHAKDRMLGKVP